MNDPPSQPRPGDAALPPLRLEGGPLHVDEVWQVAMQARLVELDPGVAIELSKQRASLEAAATDGEPHYGINTGFGSFSRERISPEHLRELQINLVRSHAAGVGAPLDVPTVRAMTLLLAASLARGRSGVRAELIERLALMLNRGVTPIVPETGSVGASGDLAPLSHLSLVLIGEGEAVLADGSRRSGAEALRSVELEPLTLEAKEGLALINGTHLMAARLSLAWSRFERLFPAAMLAAAMSLDACRATDAFLDPRVYEARGHAGPAAVAGRMRALLAGSEILPSHATPDDPRVQDPYSIRCSPIVLGTVLDLSGPVRGALDAELGAVTDNPLFFLRDGGDGADIISAGNFHGAPVAIPADALAIGLSNLANLSERRTYHMISARDPETRLRPFLSPMPGLHSGYMIPQYTAAACCNELASLASPASVVNLPTSAGMEDVNSFGPRSVAKLHRGLDLTRTVVAIELLCAAQALEMHRPLRSGGRVEAAHAVIRERVRALEADRPPAPDIEAIEALIESGSFGEPMLEFDRGA